MSSYSVETGDWVECIQDCEGIFKKGEKYLVITDENENEIRIWFSRDNWWAGKDKFKPIFKEEQLKELMKGKMKAYKDGETLIIEDYEGDSVVVHKEDFKELIKLMKEGFFK